MRRDHRIVGDRQQNKRRARREGGPQHPVALVLKVGGFALGDGVQTLGRQRGHVVDHGPGVVLAGEAHLHLIDLQRNRHGRQPQALEIGGLDLYPVSPPDATARGRTIHLPKGEPS